MAAPYRCTGCSLIALLEGGGHSSTFRASRTPGTPACPACGTSSWVDPMSFTAFYMKLSSNEHTCVIGPHEDASVRHVQLLPSHEIPPPAPRAIVIMKVSAGLCTEHLIQATSVGIGGFLIAIGDPGPFDPGVEPD